MNKAEQAARQHASQSHARAVAALYEDRQPTPHDQLSRTQRYVMVNHGTSTFVRIITIMNELYFVPPSGFPFSVASVPDAQFYPVAKQTASPDDEIQYRIEIVWNREQDWCLYGPRVAQLDDCLTIVDDLLSQGDGARVKKARVVNDHGQVVWAAGRLVNETTEKS